MADDRRLEAFVRQSGFGVWHASGTCRMVDSSDPRAVVATSLNKAFAAAGAALPLAGGLPHSQV